MIIVATDAPLNPRNLDRMAMRSMMGLARTGSYASNGSGDYVIAFSTNTSLVFSIVFITSSLEICSQDIIKNKSKLIINFITQQSYR